ncbi:MAG: hypothetical protein JOZ83_13760 [Silvibacterium sp.]|nr:hypothetical protein [Silvibacterium sp.]
MAITLEDLFALIEKNNKQIDELYSRVDWLSGRIEGVTSPKRGTSESAPEFSNKGSAHVREEKPKPRLRPDDRRPESLAKIIANELGTRDQSVREAVAVAVRDELEAGRTEVEAHETITNQWLRWERISELFPGISTAQFFRSSRNCLSKFELEAPGKRQEALKRQEQQSELMAERKHPPQRAQRGHQPSQNSAPHFRLPDNYRFNDPELDALFQRYVKTPVANREKLFGFHEISLLAAAEAAYNEQKRREWLDARKAAGI